MQMAAFRIIALKAEIKTVQIQFITISYVVFSTAEPLVLTRHKRGLTRLMQKQTIF